MPQKSSAPSLVTRLSSICRLIRIKKVISVRDAFLIRTINELRGRREGGRSGGARSRRWCDRELRGVRRGLRYSIHDPTRKHNNNIRREMTVRRHGTNQSLRWVIWIGNRISLNDSQQITACVARNHI